MSFNVFGQVGEESRHLGNLYLWYLDYVSPLHQIISSLCNNLNLITIYWYFSSKWNFLKEFFSFNFITISWYLSSKFNFFEEFFSFDFLKLNPTPFAVFSPIPRIQHPWPNWTCGSVRDWLQISYSPLFLLLI